MCLIFILEYELRGNTNRSASLLTGHMPGVE
jgi:hypothetical protein